MNTNTRLNLMKQNLQEVRKNEMIQVVANVMRDDFFLFGSLQKVLLIRNSVDSNQIKRYKEVTAYLDALYSRFADCRPYDPAKEVLRNAHPGQADAEIPALTNEQKVMALISGLERTIASLESVKRESKQEALRLMAKSSPLLENSRKDIALEVSRKGFKHFFNEGNAELAEKLLGQILAQLKEMLSSAHTSIDSTERDARSIRILSMFAEMIDFQTDVYLLAARNLTRTYSGKPLYLPKA